MINTNLLAMADCPSDKTAEDIALPDIRWCNTFLVSKDKNRGTDMIRDNAD